MMTPEQIAAMRADAEAGTPGPWSLEGAWEPTGSPLGGWLSKGTQATTHSPLFEVNPICGTPNEICANARRIARVPDMEATIIAQAAEIERLRGLVTQKPA